MLQYEWIWKENAKPVLKDHTLYNPIYMKCPELTNA